MSNLYEVFETDDPEQMHDILFDVIGQLIEADRAGDGSIIEELWDKLDDMVTELIMAV